MNNLTMDLVSVDELQSIDMRLTEDMPPLQKNITDQITEKVYAGVEFIFYLTAIAVVFGVVGFFALSMAVNVFVSGWLFLDDHFPRPITEESSNVYQVKQQIGPRTLQLETSGGQPRNHYEF